jgi:VanZ family protein
MSTKALTGGIITGVLAFFIGWLVFGILLMDWYTAHSYAEAKMVMKPEPVIWMIAAANLLFGLMLAYVCHLGNVKTPRQGAMVCGIVSFFMTATFDLYMLSQMKLIGKQAALVDVAANTVVALVLGAFLGWWLGRGSKAVA